MADVNQKELDLLLNDSIQLLRDVLGRRIEAPLSDLDQLRIKAASNVLASYPRMRQAQASVADTSLKILEMASDNKDQLKEWVRLQIPHTQLIKTNLPQIFEKNKADVIDAEKRAQATNEKFIAEREAWKKERDELTFKIMQLEERNK